MTKYGIFECEALSGLFLTDDAFDKAKASGAAIKTKFEVLEICSTTGELPCKWPPYINATLNYSFRPIKKVAEFEA